MAIGAVALVAVVAPFTGCADDGSRTEVAASSSDGGDIADVLPFAETTTTTTTSAAPPPPTTQAFVASPSSSPPPATGGDCHPSYDPCLPIVGDLDCPDIGHRVRVIGPDDYRLDREGDGVGCESY